MSKAGDAFFVDRPKVGKRTVQPFTAGRVKYLRRRGNSFFSGDSDQDEVDAAIELFFVATRETKELLKLRRATTEEWDDAVEEFALTLEAGELEEFSRIAEEEFKLIDESHATPRKKRDPSPTR